MQKKYSIYDNKIVCDIDGAKLEFINIGEVSIETDDLGNRIKINDSNNCVLYIKTGKARGKAEAIIGKKSSHARPTQKKNYDTISSLDGVWNKSGIYMFVSKDENKGEIRYKYIGRTSNKILKRIKGYLCPTAGTQSTNREINEKLFTCINNGEKILLYFYESKDIEMELRRKLKPEWNPA